MRLLIVSGVFHPDVGGPATYLYELAHALTTQGHDVAVLTYGRPDPPGSYPFQVWRVPPHGSAAARLCRFTRVLLQVSRAYPLWYVNDYGVPTLVAGAVRRPRMVMKIVGDFAWEYARRNYLIEEGIDAFQTKRHGARLEALKALQRSYVGRATRVIVPSEYLRGIVCGWGVAADRVTVVKNAPSWTTVAAPGLVPPREPATLFTAARLAPWKGMDHVLRTFAILRPSVPGVRIVVAGDGPERVNLQVLARELRIGDDVTWLGDVQRDCVLHWMRRATAFVLLSEYEGLSHVLLEAMTQGLPVVASAAGGNRELVADGESGLIVDPADHSTTAARIASLLRDAGLRARLAAAARARAQAHTWDGLLAETCAVFDAASAGAP